MVQVHIAGTYYQNPSNLARFDDGKRWATDPIHLALERKRDTTRGRKLGVDPALWKDFYPAKMRLTKEEKKRKDDGKLNDLVHAKFQ
jgi:hypothetical protein